MNGITSTTSITRTVVFGAAAHGGKIHRTNAGGHAFCLNDRGHKPMRSIVASVEFEGYADFEAEAAALLAAGVGHASLCRKCAKTTAAVLHIREMAAAAEVDVDADDDDEADDDACGSCGGDGFIPCIDPNADPYVECPSCDGRGTN